MNRVLIVAYLFPPFGGGFVIRIYNFVKNIPQFGWQPIVLTVKERWYEGWYSIPTHDYSMKLSDSFKVIRTNSWEPTAIGSKNIQAKFTRSPRAFGKALEILKYLKKELVEIFAIPDERVLWIPNALKEGAKLLSNEEIDAILITVPPHSTWILGYLLNRIGKKPLIIDVRDDWIGNPNYRPKYLHRYLAEKMMEKRIVLSSAAIICATEESRELFINKYPECSPHKFVLIPNGYNPDDIPKISLKNEICHKLHLIYTGIIPKKRSPECLFIALKELCDELHNKEYLELHIYGIMQENYCQMLLDYNLEKLVKYEGYVPHDECIKQIIKSDVGLVIIPPIEGSETAIPGKIYEYLACDKFILTLADKDSAVARLVIKEKLGIVADPRSVEEIKKAIKQVLEMFKRGFLSQQYSNDIKQRYNRINHSKQLSDLLLQVVY